MKKVIALFLIPVIALSLIGTSYALWSKTITLSGTIQTGTVDKKMTGILCSEFYNPKGVYDPSSSDFGMIAGEVEGKNVGVCTPSIDIGGDSGNVIIDNAYPSYAVSVDYKERNAGTIPLKVNDLILVWTDPLGAQTTVTCTGEPCALVTADAEIYFEDNFGTQLEPGASIGEELIIHMKQGAIQGASYSLKLKERAVQWNEYPAP